MTQILELLPEVLLRIPEIAEPLAERYVARGVQEWYKASDTWRPRLDPVVTYDGVNDFTLSLPANTVVNRVFWVKANGAPLRALATEDLAEGRLSGAFVHLDGTVELTPVTPRGELQLGVSVYPTLTNTEVPDALFTEHYDGLLDTIMYLLYSIPGQPWTSTEAVSAYMSLVNSHIAKARRDADGRRWNRALTVQYGGL